MKADSNIQDENKSDSTNTENDKMPEYSQDSQVNQEITADSKIKSLG